MEFILNRQSCEACRADAPQATEEQVATLKVQIPEWEILEAGGVKQLSRSFLFKNFRQALDFSILVGEMAEKEGHHPQLTTEWGKVGVLWWSHSIGGLHVNDFIAAAKTDELFAGQSGEKSGKTV